MAEAVYLMCALTSLACAALLVRSYRRSGLPLILWTSMCFLGLAVNNLLLFVDLAMVPSVDLRLARGVAGVAGVALLLYGMITRSGRTADTRAAR